MPQSLPANPNVDWLKKTAKQRLAQLRAREPAAKLHQAQLAVAREYGFTSWRALAAHINATASAGPHPRHVFDAARAGDTEVVRRALEAGFDPATQDADGRTLYQIAKEGHREEIELMIRDLRERNSRPQTETEAVRALLRAAQAGDVATLLRSLDAHPEFIDAMDGGIKKATALHLAVLGNRHDAVRLLIERGADLDPRDFPDNATPLHFAAVHGDLETIRLLVEAGADVDGLGDDYELGVLGWATCFREPPVREDVAEYLLAHGAALNPWTAIALGRAAELRLMIANEPALLGARMTRNQHRRTLLHHAAAKNRAEIVRLLLELGTDPHATDATGATALATASLENADTGVISALVAAGAVPDFLTVLNLGNTSEAEAMLRADPSRIGPTGTDTIALHLAVNRRNVPVVRWLLAHGVDVNAKRSLWDCNHTALHMTVESGAIAIAQLLLEAGADPEIKDDKYHATALGWAEYFGRKDFVEFLQARGTEKT